MEQTPIKEQEKKDTTELDKVREMWNKFSQNYYQLVKYIQS